MKVNRVERHIITSKHELYKQVDELCFISKNLYNYANYLIRQTFIITSKLSEGKEITEENQGFLNFINSQVDRVNLNKEQVFNKKKEKDNAKFRDKTLKSIKYFDKDYKYIGYDLVDFICKDNENYKLMMAQSSQQTLRVLDKNWQSFFESIKDWSKNKSKYTGRPKLPNYKSKNGRFNIYFTNQNCKIKDGKIQFPKCLNQYELTTKVKDGLQQVRILPRNQYFVIEIVYTQEAQEELCDNGKYVSIDIGLDNLATMTNNCGITPVIISGRKLKSINKHYNKQVSHYREIAKRMNKLDYTNKMNKLTIKRNNMITDLIHKASKSVIEYALSCGANTIVIGNNKDWKRESSMSKKVNQSFVGIPHQEFINKIIYKAQNVGVKVIITEESYTSGTSFIDNELPIKENYNKSRRVFRGLFVSNNGKKINSDVNGSYQILKKVFPNAYSHGIEDYGFNPIRVGL